MAKEPIELTEREWRQFLVEKLDYLGSRQGAIARATTNLADGLSSAETRHQIDGERWTNIQGAALSALAERERQDLSVITAHDLAGSAPPEVINKARAIQWARKKGEPEPLPDAPDEAVALHHHRRKDDSIAFEVDKSGDTRMKTNIKLKTLAGWGVAIILGGIHVWKLIAEAIHK